MVYLLQLDLSRNKGFPLCLSRFFQSISSNFLFMTNSPFDPNYTIFSEYKIAPEVEICIVIPVKDEEIYILKTLNAFVHQTDLNGHLFNREKFEILVLANNCTDNSVALIKKFQQENPFLNIYLTEITLPKSQSNIGYVRRILMNTAWKRLTKNDRGFIMTTDGDTQVSRDWIAQNLNEFRNGADAVGGRILLAEDELELLDKNTVEIHFKDEEYQLLIAELEAEIFCEKKIDNPNHHQHFNGSFAITTELYHLSGGIPDVTHLEDCAFFDRLQRFDAKIHHSSSVLVYTSARCVGRTDVGLSSQLNEWKVGKLPSSEMLVVSADSIVFLLNLKKSLQDIWNHKIESSNLFEDVLRQIIPSIEISESDFEIYQSNIYFGAWFSDFVDQHQEKWVRKNNLEPIDNAISKLKEFVKDYSTSSFSQTSIR